MENMNHSDNGTFVVKKNKKISILAFAGCFLLAFIIWTYVINVKISDNSKTFTIKMDIRGEEALLDEKNYSVFGGTETWVKVTVQGTNADLNKCSEKDFGVYVDVSDIEKTGMTPLNIVVESKSTAVSVVSTDPVQTTVFVDERIKDKSITLEKEIIGDESAIDDKINVSTNVLSVSGPKTYVNEISYAKIMINASEVNGGNKNSFKIVFYDSHNNVVESPYLVYNSSEITISTGEQ